MLISESTNRQKWDSINYLINSNETIKNMIQIEDTSNLLIEALNIYNINSLLTNQIDNIENLLFQLYFYHNIPRILKTAISSSSSLYFF